jgi:predicted ArsR family transcriptional regulator
MTVTDKLPPLAVQVLRSLRQTYDHRGPNAFDEDATKVFHVMGWIIAQVCGRERLAESMKRLEAALNMEGVGEPDDGSVPSVH